MPHAFLPAVDLRNTGKYRQAMYRAIVALILAAFTIWSALWFISQRIVRDSLMALSAQLQDSGLTVNYSDLRIRGYPYRLDATLDELVIADPKNGTEWRAPYFQLLMLIYSTNHIIAVWPEEQEFEISGRTHAVRSKGLRASLKTDGRNSEIERFVVETERLSVDGLPLSVESVLIALRQQGENGNSYEFSLSTEIPEPAPPPEGSHAIPVPAGDGRFVLRADLEFNRPLSGSTCAGGAGRLLALRVPEATLAWPSIALRGESDISFDENGLASGPITLSASDPSQLADLLGQNSLALDSFGSIALRIASLAVNGNEAQLTLTNGKIGIRGFLGGLLDALEIGKFPPLRICS